MAETAETAASGTLQPPQNFAAGSLENPHAGQAADSDPPHSEQNRRPAAFRAPQRGQFTEQPLPS